MEQVDASDVTVQYGDLRRTVWNSKKAALEDKITGDGDQKRGELGVTKVVHVMFANYKYQIRRDDEF